MIPILFPYTYLSRRTLEPITILFGKVILYQPFEKSLPVDLEESVRSGMIEIRIPIEGNDKQLTTILSEYRSWADLHHISQRKYHKMTHDLKVSTQEPKSSQIRQEIRDRLTGGKEQNALTPADSARLFLKLAQEFDMQQSGLFSEIGHIQDMQQQLFSDLRGDGLDRSDPIPGVESTRPEPADHMISERLSAWTHLLCHDTPSTCIFVTTSNEAFQMVSNQVERMHVVSGFDERPVEISDKDNPLGEGHAISDYLAHLSTSETDAFAAQPFGDVQTDAAGRKSIGRLTVSMVPNLSPPEVFGKLLHPHIRKAASSLPLCRNTILALLELSFD